MKTLLSRFCEEFEGAVRPLLAPLGSAADTLDKVSPDLPVRRILPGVREASHHLASLADKVAEQQAYVIIFGPLKSGKSTLMNGIAAAYVSEVTTLPAYPCMVYVQHAPEQGFTVSRYNGEQETFTDIGAMRTVMEFAHNELANRLREVEESGEAFDPAQHLPSAIRRVDVRLPAPDLAESSAVLVDTPGLYSRMKFGYDRMTREFRDSAACAVFVVKTDNLFLEQVFEEFEDLLELFSRIFLVVNLDTTKQDLKPDGQLGESLEKSDPTRIIEAFRNLAMSGPVKQAADEGRLRIFPVDLLHAAADRLQHPGATSGAAAVAAEGEDADTADGATAGEVATPTVDDGSSFGPFLDGLTDYLNSTDYLVAFLGDSLRQAQRLLQDVSGLCDEESVRQLNEKVGDLRGQQARCAEVSSALDSLATVRWKASFERLGEDLASITRGRIEKLDDETRDGMADALDHWFDGDGSFQSLIDDHVSPVVRKARDDLANTANGVFQTVAGNDTAGAELPPAARAALKTLDLAVGDIGQAVMARLDLGKGLGRATLAVSTEEVPVRKGLLDWLLFRSQFKVRRRLFGPDESPDREIPRHVKAKRLGDKGRDAIDGALGAALTAFFDKALHRLTGAVLEQYTAAVKTGVTESMARLHKANARTKEIVERQLAQLVAVSGALEGLRLQLDQATSQIDGLGTRYGDTDPQLLSQPVDEDDDADVVLPVNGNGTSGSSRLTDGDADDSPCADAAAADTEAAARVRGVAPELGGGR